MEIKDNAINPDEKKEKRRYGKGAIGEHTIRDDADFALHFDYIHFNPVKHGFVNSPHEWKWSSFHRYLKLGYYPEDWGSEQPFTFQ